MLVFPCSELVPLVATDAPHPSPTAIDRPPWPSASPHSATTARAQGGRPCTYLMQREPSSPLDSMHGRQKSELPHNGAQAPRSSACFPAPLLLTHAKLRRRGPIITARAARGGKLGGGVAAGLNCVLATAHGVSSPKKISREGKGSRATQASRSRVQGWPGGTKA